MSEATEANPAEDSELLSDEGAEDHELNDQNTGDEGDNSDEEPPEEDDSEEVEHDGAKYKVPKALKDAFLRQADYTRKTMDLADARKALDTEKASYTEASQEVLDAKADLIATDRQLAQYANIDWQAWGQTDPSAANAAFFQYQQLRDGRAQIAETVTAKTQALTTEAQRSHAKQLQDGIAVLQRDIPGWGQELAAKLMDFGASDFGYTREELDRITDPRVIKAIHAAYTLKQAQTKQNTVQKIAAVQATKPAATVGGRGAVSATGLDDRLSNDEWMRRRNAQVAKRQQG